MRPLTIVAAMIVGFLGAGSMAAAMARGWAGASSGAPQRMLFTDSGSGRAASLAAEVGGEALDSNAELAAASDLLVLAVKPKNLGDVAGGSQGAPAVLSLLGATPVATVAAAYPGAAAMRVMPNLGVAVRAGVLCFAGAEGVDEGAERRTLDVLRLLGRVELVADSEMDAATAVMACPPAYLALAADAIASAGADAGLDPSLSLSLIRGTMAATAELLADTPPADLIEAVASPGGSTEAGLEALGEHGARDAFVAAVRRSIDRMEGRA